jgi:multiple sugar transport system substrate-binding protein
MTTHRRAAVVAAAALLALAGCGGGSGESTDAASTDALGPDAMADAADGTITWCAQKDSSGAFTAIVDEFNADPANAGLTLKLLEFPESTDEWRNQFVQRQQAKSSECDIFGSDVVWTAEFAQKGFLYDLTPYVESRTEEFIPSTLGTTKVGDSNWAVPFGTNVAFLYYRTDQVSQAPATWQEAYADGQANQGLLYQASAYEGLTVNFVTLATAAGGQVLSDDGKSSAIDSPENLDALQLMVDGLQDGAVPRDVLTYTEEETRRGFEAGQGSLAVNWTYAYVLGQKAPIAGSFDAVPLPAWEGREASGVLGGVNLVISKFSKNPGGALKALDAITSLDGQVTAATHGQAPTVAAAYDDAAVQQAMPFWQVLEQGVAQAVSRPVTPVYAQVSQAIYRNVSAALSGEVTPEEALKKADQEINAALATF